MNGAEHWKGGLEQPDEKPDPGLEQKFRDAIWIGKVLFDRNKVSGSSANMSFLHEGKVYITGSGTCFGRLTKEDFAVTTPDGEHLAGPKPSKELPLHLALYKNKPDVQAVIHTHSFYSTLWSCLRHENERDIMPEYTPYLRNADRHHRTHPVREAGLADAVPIFRGTRPRQRRLHPAKSRSRGGRSGSDERLLQSGGTGGKRPDRMGIAERKERPSDRGCGIGRIIGMDFLLRDMSRTPV